MRYNTSYQIIFCNLKHNKDSNFRTAPVQYCKDTFFYEDSNMLKFQFVITLSFFDKKKKT